MFDFFRDIYLESVGIDTEQAEKERKEKQEKKKRERFIFTKSTKTIVYFLGIIYLFLAGFGISMKKQLGILSGYDILIFIFLSICCITTMILLAIGKKKGEIISLILILVFAVIQYITTVLGI